MLNPTLQQIPSVNGLWSSFTGGAGVRQSGDGALPVPLQGGLADLTSVLNADPTKVQGLGNATPVDTRTQEQRAADNAAGRIYNIANGSYTQGPVPSASDTTGGGPGWNWRDPLGIGAATQKAGNELLLTVSLVALGTGLAYLGFRTLVE